MAFWDEAGRTDDLADFGIPFMKVLSTTVQANADFIQNRKKVRDLAYGKLSTEGWLQYRDTVRDFVEDVNGWTCTKEPCKTALKEYLDKHWMSHEPFIEAIEKMAHDPCSSRGDIKDENGRYVACEQAYPDFLEDVLEDRLPYGYSDYLYNHPTTMEHRNDVIHDNIYSTHPPGDKEGGGNRWVWVGIAVGLLILIIVFVLMYKK